MDLETLLLVAAALAGTVAAVAHLLGYVPPRYKRVLGQISASQVKLYGQEVERALNASLDRQRALTLEDMKHAEEAAKAEVDHTLAVAKGSIARGVRTDREALATANELVLNAILGPGKLILAQFAPGLVEQLEEHPELLPLIVENPMWKKYVEPRLRPLIEKYIAGGGEETATDTGFGR